MRYLKHRALGVFHRILSLPLNFPYCLQRRVAILRGKRPDFSYPDGYVGSTEPEIAATPVAALEKTILQRAQDLAQETGQQMVILSGVKPTFREDLPDFFNKNGVAFLELSFSGSEDFRPSLAFRRK